MANNPTILIFGLPEEEATLLRGGLALEEGLLEPLVGIHRSLGSLIDGPGFMKREDREAVWLVVLDRTYDIAAHTYSNKGTEPASFPKQLACVRTWFPNAQVLCTTNSPLRFNQEHPCGTAFSPCFVGTASYASLHRNLHFGEAPQK